MAFSDGQLRALRRRVAPRNIKTRVSDGKELSYVEGWFVIAEANRIFGFDGWDRETLEAKCVAARDSRGGSTAIYTTRVRVTVRTADGIIIRDGSGTGEGRGDRVGEAHDLALKAAETDATKRALVTFGRAFGLLLYSGRRHQAEQQEALTHVPKEGPSPPGTKIGAQISLSVRPNDAPARQGRVDKSELALGEPRRLRDKDHLRYVASQPCILCNRILAEAHHVRFAQPKAFGAKVSDEFTVPLCRDHHRELHNNGNERAWWHDMGVDPLPVAHRLWEQSHGGNRINGDGGTAGSTEQPMPAAATTNLAPELIRADEDHRLD